MIRTSLAALLFSCSAVAHTIDVVTFPGNNSPPLPTHDCETGDKVVHRWGDAQHRGGAEYICIDGVLNTWEPTGPAQYMGGADPNEAEVPCFFRGDQYHDNANAKMFVCRLVAADLWTEVTTPHQRGVQEIPDDKNAAVLCGTSNGGGDYTVTYTWIEPGGAAGQTWVCTEDSQANQWEPRGAWQRVGVDTDPNLIFENVVAPGGPGLYCYRPHLDTYTSITDESRWWATACPSDAPGTWRPIP